MTAYWRQTGTSWQLRGLGLKGRNQLKLKLIGTVELLQKLQSSNNENIETVVLYMQVRSSYVIKDSKTVTMQSKAPIKLNLNNIYYIPSFSK